MCCTLCCRHHPEQPARISSIYDKLVETGLAAKCSMVQVGEHYVTKALLDQNQTKIVVNCLHML